MARLDLTPLSALQVLKFLIPSHNLIPNTSIQNRPLLIYKSCFPPNSGASAVESHLKSVGVVSPQWRYSMYPTSHFHSTTHEVLCVVKGRALLLFGGEDNPGKVEHECKAGDVIIIPAGVAHRLLDDYGSGYEMVGSYPVGATQWDMCYGREDEEDKVKNIRKLNWFDNDPLYGQKGPVTDA
ncbi:cupin domain-containing protein [Ditylenchus destructor]|nr:cupin domain-containing protein [Ditylenchus destructor]